MYHKAKHFDTRVYKVRELSSEDYPELPADYSGNDSGPQWKPTRMRTVPYPDARVISASSLLHPLPHAQSRPSDARDLQVASYLVLDLPKLEM
jgi:hypothetical protein